MNAERRHKNEVSDWLSSRFCGDAVANITINLRPFFDGKNGIVSANCTEADAKRLASRFRNEVNQRFFGKKARRFGRDAGLRIVSNIHTEPHWHLHILCEIPAALDTDGRERFAELADFLRSFCVKHRMVSGDFYIEEARNVVASVKYNSRNGTDTVIDF